MQVETSHHVDASEPDEDGMYGWRYEYDLMRFSDTSAALVARVDVADPGAVQFLRLEIGGEWRALELEDLSSKLVRDAVAHLRGLGFQRIEWLGSTGYESLPSM